MRTLITVFPLLFYILFPFGSFGQTPGAEKSLSATNSQDRSQYQAGEEREFPGAGEALSRLGQLQGEVTPARNQIADIEQVGAAGDSARRAEERLQKLRQQRINLGAVGTWSVYRLQDLSSRLEELQHRQQSLLDSLADKIKKLEDLQKSWQKKQSFWTDWRDRLQRTETDFSAEVFARAQKLIGEVLGRSDEAMNKLVRLQGTLFSLEDDTRSAMEEIQRVLHQDTFKKGSPTFFEPKFYRQFNPELWRSVKEGIADVETVDKIFLQQQGWLIVLQLLSAFAIGGFIRRYKSQAETAEEWEFLLNHPWATGIFVAFAALRFFYVYPPALWEFLQWILAAGAAAVLLAALLRNSRKIILVLLLAGLFVLSFGLQLISLPQPLYRLYLAFVALAGIPLLIWFSRRLGSETEKATGFIFGLRLGSLILFVALIAQMAGFNILAFRLFESSIKTVFLVLLSAMFIRLGQGAIDFIFDQETLRQWRFFRRFGQELSRKLKHLFKFVVILNALIYLLQVWNLYGTVFEAWRDLLDLDFSVGEMHVTVKMVLVVILVVYASIVTSWSIRAILEAEVFPRQRLDRGLRDSIKRLLHYCLILVGFLMALTLAGVELKNFAVLAGAFGIGIGFGLQNIVNNFVSGLILLFERPVKVGDMIIVDQEWGTVRNIGLRSTIVTTLDESEIIVPNSMLISEKVTNWSLSSPEARIAVPVGVAYGSDVPLVLKILNGVGKGVPDVLDEPAPSSLFKGFGDSSLDFEIRAWIADVRDRPRVRSEICQYIDRRFREENITIPFPQRDLHLQSLPEGLAEKFSRKEEKDKKVRGPQEGSVSMNQRKEYSPKDSKKRGRSSKKGFQDTEDTGADSGEGD